MGVHLTSFCALFLYLQVRNNSTVEALSHYGASGENMTFPCILYPTGTVKMFCRETCEGENLLIKTTNDTAQIGRYRTEYVREASTTFSVLSVSILELTWSDSGRYRCGLGDSSSSASYQDFSLLVVDALLDGSKDPHLYKEAGSSLTVACFFKYSGRKRLFCRGECGEEEVLVLTDGVRAENDRFSIEYDEGHKSEGVLLVTITNLTQSDSGRYRCKMDRTFLPDLHKDFSITVTDDYSSTSTPTTTTQSFSSSSTAPTAAASSSTPAPPLTPPPLTPPPPPTTTTKTTTTTQSFSSSSTNVTHPSPFQINNGPVQIQDTRVKSTHNFPLIVGVTLVLVVVLVSAALLVSCRRRFLRDVKNRGSNIGKVTYNNSSSEDSDYLNLSSDTRDQNQIYWTLEELK